MIYPIIKMIWIGINQIEIKIFLFKFNSNESKIIRVQFKFIKSNLKVFQV